MNIQIIILEQKIPSTRDLSWFPYRETNYTPHLYYNIHAILMDIFQVNWVKAKIHYTSFPVASP